MGALIEAVIELVSNIAGASPERRRHPLLIASYVLLGIVAVALLGLWLAQ